MAVSKLNDIDRKRRKREAAKLRQRRCRAKKALQRKEQALEESKAKSRLESSESLSESDARPTLNTEASRASSLPRPVTEVDLCEESRRTPTPTFTPIERKLPSSSHESSVPESHVTSSVNRPHLRPRQYPQPYHARSHSYPSRQHPLYDQGHEHQVDTPTPCTPARPSGSKLPIIITPRSTLNFPHEPPVSQLPRNTSASVSRPLSDVSAMTTPAQRPSVPAFQPAVGHPVMFSGKSNNSDVRVSRSMADCKKSHCMNDHEMTAIEAMISLRHSPVSVPDQHLADNTYDTEPKIHAHGCEGQTPKIIRPTPRMGASPLIPVFDAMPKASTTNHNKYNPVNPHATAQMTQRGNSLTKNPDLNPGVYFYYRYP